MLRKKVIKVKNYFLVVSGSRLGQGNVVMPDLDTVAPIWEHSRSYNHRVFSDDITTSPRSINLMDSFIYLTAI